jgi:hypothetical protein
MQDHTLRVGEELVIQGYVRLTILGVEQGRVVFGITAEPNDMQDPGACPWRDWLTAVPVPVSNDN